MSHTPTEASMLCADTPGSVRVARTPIPTWQSYFGKDDCTIPCIWDAPHLRGTASGRAAIALALHAFGIRKGDRVLVPTYHCATMVAPIAAIGAEPLFFPIPSSGVPTADLIESSSDNKTRAVIVPHYFGLPTPMSAIRRFCDRRGLCLIEDCAHAFFGLSDEQPIGSWGDYSIASLPKFFPVTEGGCLASWKHELPPRPPKAGRFAAEIKALAGALESGARYGQFPGANFVINTAFAIRHRAMRTSASLPQFATPPSYLDIDALIEELRHRAISPSAPTRTSWLLARHYRRQRLVTRRRQNYQLMAELLQDLAGARVLYPSLPPSAVPYVLPLLVSNPERSYQGIRAAGVSVYRWDMVRWPGVPHLPQDVGAEWSQTLFQLNVHQDLRTPDIHAIAGTIRKIFDTASTCAAIVA